MNLTGAGKDDLLHSLFEFAVWLDQTGNVSKAERESGRGSRRRDEALKVYQRVLREREASGPEALETDEVLKKLAYLLQDLGRESEAIALLRRLVESSRAAQDDLLALSAMLSNARKREEAHDCEEWAKKLPTGLLYSSDEAYKSRRREA